MSWQTSLKGDPLPWLLQSERPGVRYLALRDLLDHPPDDPELLAARQAAHASGPIATILDHMEAGGYWSKPGPGYNPKYYSTDWSIIQLAQLGASPAADERVSLACSYLLDHAFVPSGQFSISGAPSGTIDCLQGNLCWALLELGCQDPRLDAAFEWMARTVTGEGLAPAGEIHSPARYYAYKCGPTFACGVNSQLPCAWGAVKVMLAFSRLPVARRSPVIERAIAHGVDFLFSVDPASAAYPQRSGDTPSRNWWKFGFPIFYITDLLQLVEALAGLGYGGDPRLAHALKLILEKQDADGRWPLEYDYAGKTWVSYGTKKKPSPWTTLRALRTLKLAYST